MVATTPTELRQFYNNRRHMQKSCGNADELEAKAMVRGAEGKAFRDAIIYKYGELNPVVMKAKGFWSRYW